MTTLTHRQLWAQRAAETRAGRVAGAPAASAPSARDKWAVTALQRSGAIDSVQFGAALRLTRLLERASRPVGGFSGAGGALARGSAKPDQAGFLAALAALSASDALSAMFVWPDRPDIQMNRNRIIRELFAFPHPSLAALVRVYSPNSHNTERVKRIVVKALDALVEHFVDVDTGRKRARVDWGGPLT